LIFFPIFYFFTYSSSICFFCRAIIVTIFSRTKKSRFQVGHSMSMLPLIFFCMPKSSIFYLSQNFSNLFYTLTSYYTVPAKKIAPPKKIAPIFKWFSTWHANTFLKLFYSYILSIIYILLIKKIISKFFLFFIHVIYMLKKVIIILSPVFTNPLIKSKEIVLKICS
jgi:hypothetical protein